MAAPMWGGRGVWYRSLLYLSPSKCPSLTFCRLLSERKTVVEILQQKAPVRESLCIKAWVNSVRAHKDVVFLHLNDGSSLKPLQVVCSPSHANSVTFGSCVSVEGELKESPHHGQALELVASTVDVIGPCNPMEYPFKAKERHSADYIRVFPHLRHRTNFFGALHRARNSATMAIHKFFQSQGYCLVNTPVITSSDCEGAGEVFQLQPVSSRVLHEVCSEDEHRSDESSKHFFGQPAYLTVSGQLHLEAVASGFSKVYTFGPTFRAENSRGRHHLSEFYMIEAELAFTHTLDDIITVMEDLVKYTTNDVLEKSREDVRLFHTHVKPGHQKTVDKIIANKFHSHAISILQNSRENFQFKVSWGDDLQKEHERYLVSHHDDVPVFVTDFPVALKPFYALANNDGKTVAAVDLLVPGVGELFGGSLREYRYDVLKDKLDALQLSEEYAWYLDLRQFGSTPHGGFGMGFERYLQCLLGIDNIKDTIPFPRSVKHCKM